MFQFEISYIQSFPYIFNYFTNSVNGKKRSKNLSPPKNTKRESGFVADQPRVADAPDIYLRGGGVKWTDVIMVIINGFLVYYTLQLFQAATLQTGIAQQAANAATNAVRQDSLNDIISNARERTNDSLAYIKDTSTLGLSRKSLDAQIGSILESQKQFETANQPFLQIANPTILPIEIGKPIEMVYHINNLTDMPVKITDQRNSLFAGRPPNTNELGKRPSIRNVNTYVIKESPLSNKTTTAELIVQESNMPMILSPDYYLYFRSEIKYKNLVTGKNRIYIAEIKLKLLANGLTYTQF